MRDRSRPGACCLAVGSAGTRIEAHRKATPRAQLCTISPINNYYECDGGVCFANGRPKHAQNL